MGFGRMSVWTQQANDGLQSPMLSAKHFMLLFPCAAH